MCCSSWGHKASDMTEQLNLIELIGLDTMTSDFFGSVSGGLRKQCSCESGRKVTAAKRVETPVAWRISRWA